MLNESTITKLREMRLSVTANALNDQFEDAQFRNMAFEDRIGLIVDGALSERAESVP